MLLKPKVLTVLNKVKTDFLPIFFDVNKDGNFRVKSCNVPEKNV